MNYFDSKYLHSIDQRGRVQLPKDVRASGKLKKGDSLFMFINPNAPRVLEVRTKGQWQAYQKQVEALPPSNAKREFYRLIRLSTVEVSADGQGRIVVPQSIRERCGFEQEVVVVNMGTYVEIWNRESVEQKYNDMLRSFNEINDQLF
jgi:MraZ protein